MPEFQLAYQILPQGLEKKFFYVWVYGSFRSAMGRWHWDSGADVGVVKKWLILNGFTISPVKYRRHHTNLSIEENVQLNEYNKQLQEFM